MNVMVIANLILIIMALLVLPVWLLHRLTLPKRVKLVVGFNYFALLLILYLQLAMMAGLTGLRKRLNYNLSNLSARLQTESVQELLPDLSAWLESDRSRGFLLPPPKQGEIDPSPSNEE